MNEDRKIGAGKTSEFTENVKASAAISVPDAPLPVKEELPESVRKLLIGYDEIELQDQLVDCVNAIGGFSTVDKLVVALYKRHKREDLTRAKIINTLNALVAEGRIGKQTSPRGYLPVLVTGTAKDTANG